MLLLLPTAAPPSFGVVYTTVDHLGENYSATIGPIRECHNEAPPCTFASVDGEVHKPLDKRGRRPVRLKNGTIAWFETHRCGANCAGSATLVFARGSALYTVAVKAGTLPITLQIANGLRPGEVAPVI